MNRAQRALPPGCQRASWREAAERAAHLGVLWTLAVAEPLFHLLERNPQFFTARGSPGGDIVGFAIAVTFGPPLLLVALEWLVSLAVPAMGRALHLVLVGALVSAIALQVVSPRDVVPATAVVLTVAVAAVLAYARLRPARSLLSVLAPAPGVFLVLFLFFSNVSGLVSPDSGGVRPGNVGSGAPVVLVIFDEFPVHSLMDARGRIDRRLYPNFARLARDATWYRNTTSVEQDTPYAVPAILDGRLPRRERLPVAADHPRNIFSLLSGHYQLHVREDATTLCAPSLCRMTSSKTYAARMGSLWHDVALVYAHLVLPDDVERDLASVRDTWRRSVEDAGTTAAVGLTGRTPRETKPHRYRRLHANLARGRPERFEGFVAGIDGGARPRLHLIHILLPHVPYQYLPTGHAYRRQPNSALPGLDSRPGFGIRFLVEQGYQRHLLQVEATDRLLGELLDRLHEVGIYDRAVVAVVADHGVSFRLGHDRRLVRPANVEDIAPVPFLVKAPGQTRGRVSDKPLRTIDVLPTVADLLGLRIPWRVDGRSAHAPTMPAERRRRIISKRFRHSYFVDTPRYQRDRQAALERKLSLFGRDPYSFGPRPDLLGRRIRRLAIAPASDQHAEIAAAERYRHVDPASGFVPAHLVGRIAGGVRDGGRTVAAAVNGTIAATGLTFSLPGTRDEQFSMMFPERLLHPGRNAVMLLLVSGGRLTSLGRAG